MKKLAIFIIGIALGITIGLLTSPKVSIQREQSYTAGYIEGYEQCYQSYKDNELKGQSNYPFKPL